MTTTSGSPFFDDIRAIDTILSEANNVSAKFYTAEQIDFCKWMLAQTTEQTPVAQLPAKFRTPECLAVAAGDNLVQFGTRKHCTFGNDVTEKGVAIPGNVHYEDNADGTPAYEFADSAKLKPNTLVAVRSFLRDDAKAPPELRTVVRITDEGIKCASMSAAQPMKQAG